MYQSQTTARAKASATRFVSGGVAEYICTRRCLLRKYQLENFFGAAFSVCSAVKSCDLSAKYAVKYPAGAIWPPTTLKIFVAGIAKNRR